MDAKLGGVEVYRIPSQAYPFASPDSNQTVNPPQCRQSVRLVGVLI
jgi:hypothetical protein